MLNINIIFSYTIDTTSNTFHGSIVIVTFVTETYKDERIVHALEWLYYTRHNNE